MHNGELTHKFIKIHCSCIRCLFRGGFYFILFRVNLRENFYFNNVPIYGYHIGIITKIAKSDYRKPPDLVQNHESYC